MKRSNPPIVEDTAVAEAPRGTATEEALERLVRLAARTLRAPIAYLSLVDEGRQTVRNVIGLPASFPRLRDLPLDHFLSEEVIAHGGAYAIEDLRKNVRAHDVPLIGEGAVSLLALPLRLESGHAIAVLGVMDRVPRLWDGDEREILADLADATLAEIRSRSRSEGFRSTSRALKESEERFRSLVENAADVITIVSAGGTIDYATPSVERVLGYAPETLTGQNAFALLHPSDAAAIIEQFSRLARGARCEGPADCRIRHSDGSWRVLEVRVNNLLHDAAVVGVVVNARDITDARQATDTQRRLQAFLEATPDFVATFDPHGRALSVNTAFRRVAGVGDEEALSTLTIADLFPPSVTERILHEGIPHATREGIWSGETVLESRERGTIPISQVILAHKAANGSLEFLSTLARDISDRIEAERTVRFQAHLLDNVGEAVIATDVDGVITYWNRAAEALYGWASAEVVGRRIVEVTPSAMSAAQADQIMKQISRGETWSGEFEVQRKDGSTFIARVTDGPVHGPNGQLIGILGISADLTEQKRVEEERRRSVELLRDAEHIAHMGSWEWDVRDGTLLWSDEMFRIYGLDPATDKPSYEQYIAQIHPEDLAHVQGTIEHALRDGQPFAMDHRIVRRDGAMRYIHGRGHLVAAQDGSPLRLMGSGQDITDRRLAEEALRQSEQDYRSIFENAHDGIVIMVPDGEIVLDVNPSACAMYGYSREEFVGLSMEVVSSDVEAGRRKVQQTLEMGDSWTFEVVQKRKDGSPVTVEITAAVVDYKGQQAILSVIRDVTERHAAEQALRESQEQLVQAQKMDAVGRLAGGIAHDFNNLLTAIKGFTELLLLDFDERDSRHSFVTEIQGAANRAAALTRQLLAFSRKQVLQPRVLNLNASVSDIEKMLRRLLGEDIHLETNLESGIGRVMADPSQIEQVVMNLAVNARDAMPSGGRILIRTSNVNLERDQIPSHSDVAPGPYVCLAVTDNGTGMTPEVQARIFEPFYTTKAKGKGTGLGLSTVYGIVQQSGGLVEVDSTLGEGTTFNVYLPRVQKEVETSSERVIDQRPVTGSETVLLVEDEAAVRVLVRRVLDRNGYRVLEAPSGMDALQLVKDHPQQIDLLLTDVVMPGMSGRELSDRLAPDFPDMRILYMSGYTDEAIVHHGVLDAGIALIEKPFTPEVLLRRIRSILDGAGASP